MIMAVTADGMWKGPSTREVKKEYEGGGQKERYIKDAVRAVGRHSIDN